MAKILMNQRLKLVGFLGLREIESEAFLPFSFE